MRGLYPCACTRFRKTLTRLMERHRKLKVVGMMAVIAVLVMASSTAGAEFHTGRAASDGPSLTRDTSVSAICPTPWPECLFLPTVHRSETLSELITIEVRVAASADDAEEDSSGSMDLTSGDLELVYDNDRQTVGMRFIRVNIPQGAEIVNAYVQFEVDDPSTDAVSLTIEGQDVDNAATFTSAAGNISSRTRTTAAVSWSPAPWTKDGEAGRDQRTPNLAPVVQEIVNRPGWSSGNALAIIVTGTGKRVADSYDGDRRGAPTLHVDYRGAASGPPVPAFPGAEGFGAESVGGRGGRVIEVTNLNDSGPGSLRAAIEPQGPRIVVFRVGGTIELQTGLEIEDPFITIAGQTAPGGGITLKNHPSDTESALSIRTHDVIVRYIRMRPGPSTQKTGNLDAIQMTGSGAYNIVIDHCSTSWATDEVMSTYYSAHDITIQWSIISEGLYCSTHTEGCHSKGLLLGSEGARNITVHHNLFAHNVERNPLIKNSGLVEFDNNVVYNPDSNGSHLVDEYAKAKLNFIGNFFKHGPNTPDNKRALFLVSVQNRGFEVYVQGNIGPHRPRDDMDETLVIRSNVDPWRQWIVPSRHAAPFVTTTSAFQAYDQVLANAGASLGLDGQGNTYWRRDSVDARVVNDVKNATGGFIDHPSEVGGWPVLSSGVAPQDTDHDGMPDEWENRFGLDASNPSDSAADADGDGYTNVEEYLNGTSPTDSSA